MTHDEYADFFTRESNRLLGPFGVDCFWRWDETARNLVGDFAFDGSFTAPVPRTLAQRFVLAERDFRFMAVPPADRVALIARKVIDRYFDHVRTAPPDDADTPIEVRHAAQGQAG